MMSSLNYMELCRLCLVKERVSIPIFEGEGDVRQIFLKIAACLPVKVARDDKLPKKICGDCMFKLDNAYQFWNTTANAEKQLLQWLGEIAIDDRKSIPSNTIETEQLVLKEEAVEQDQGSELAKSLSRVEAVLADDGRGGSEEEEEEETESEEEGSNSEDSGDDDGGEAPSKEEAESDEEPYEPLEPTTFVNVSLAGCDEAGPSGIQQEQQQQQQKKQHSLQQGQQSSQPQQETQPQSQFLTPGAPSTSTATPASASGSSEDSTAGNICSPSFTSPCGGTLVGPLGGQIFTVIPGSDYEFVCVLPPLMLKNQYSDNTIYNIKLNNQSDTQSGVREVSQLNRKSEIKIGSHSFNKWSIKHSTDVVPGFISEPVLEDQQLKMAIPGIENEQLAPMKESGKRKNYTCEKCGKAFKFNYKLKRHLSAHSLDRPFECRICNKKFKSKHDARAHERKHNKDKKEICDICGYATAFRSTLEIHKMRHLGQFRLKCDACGKGFFSKLDLEGHMNAHMGEKPFQCDVCGKLFINKKHYTYHMKSSHPDPDENRSYLCKHCGKSFCVLPAFRAHKRLHMNKERSVFVCDICGKAVTTHTSLVSHRRIHTGEKPFACTTCGKKFNSQSYLKVHDRTHSGQRPHSCDLCGKSFTQQSSLVVHKRYHSGKKPYHCLVCSKAFVTRTLLKMHQRIHNTDTH